MVFHHLVLRGENSPCCAVKDGIVDMVQWTALSVFLRLGWRHTQVKCYTIFPFIQVNFVSSENVYSSYILWNLLVDGF